MLCIFVTECAHNMERHELINSEFLHPDIDNQQLLSLEKSTRKTNLEIEVLDIGQLGILPCTVKVKDEAHSSSKDGDFSEGSFCNISNRDSVSLRVEMNSKKSSKPQSRNYSCKHCNLFTKNPREYLYHLRNIHGEKAAIHECRYCEYASKHIKNLHRHCHLIHKLQPEKGESKKPSRSTRLPLSHPSANVKLNSEKLQCELCNFTSASKRILNAHVAYHNTPLKIENEEVEDINSKNYSKAYKFETEAENSDFHSSNGKFELMKYNSPLKCKKYKCALCEMSFRYIAWMIKHLRQVHAGNLQAETLAANYEIKKSMHRRSGEKHSNNNKLQMSQFINELEKPMHLHASSFVPEHTIMNSGNFSSSSMSRQSVKHYKDTSCEKLYINSENVMSCNICGHKFKWMFELQEHMQIHSSKISCYKCEYSCKLKKELKYHLLSYHGIVTSTNMKESSNLNVVNSLSTKLVNDLPATVTKEMKQCASAIVQLPQQSSRNFLDYNTENFSKMPSNCDLELYSIESQKCDTADVNFSTPVISKLNEHTVLLKNIREKLRVKNTDLKYQCPYCPFAIMSISRFHIHMMQHLKTLHFKCSDCDYNSSWKWIVIKHIWSKIIHEKTHCDAFVLLNNESVNCSFNMYKKYLNCNQNVGHQLNMLPQVSRVREIQNIRIHVPGFKNALSSNSTTLKDSPGETLYYYCKECSFKNVSKQIVISHLATHAGIKPFQCCVCDLKSNWQHIVLRHMKNVHNKYGNVIKKKIDYVQEGFILQLASVSKTSGRSNACIEKLSHEIYNCQICPYTCSEKFHMKFHMKQHKHQVGANYKCDKCPFYVKFEKSLARHQKLHNNSSLINCANNYPRDFGNCDFHHYLDSKSNSDPILLSSIDKMGSVKTIHADKIDHMLLLEISELKLVLEKVGDISSLHKCVYCPASFFKLSVLEYHMSLHGSNGQFKCRHCDYAVKKIDNINVHNLVHVKKSPKKYIRKKSLECTRCPARFSQKDRYKRHLELHGKNYKFTCNQCDFSVQGAVNLIKHKKIHVKRKSEFVDYSKTLTCPKCPTFFSQKDRYEQHLEHHGKNYKFACDHCDYSVQGAVNLIKHKKVHDIKKKAELDGFTNYKNLNSAYKTQESVTNYVPDTHHHERKLFICDRCPYYNANKVSVQSHQRSHWFRQGFECPHCDYSSVHKSSLQSHMKLHLEASNLFPPEAFMKFQSFKIYVQEESGEKLVFDDETMVRNEIEKSKLVDNIKDKSNSNNNSESEELSERNHSCISSISLSHSKSNRVPVVVLSDIFDRKIFSDKN